MCFVYADASSAFFYYYATLFVLVYTLCDSDEIGDICESPLRCFGSDHATAFYMMLFLAVRVEL